MSSSQSSHFLEEDDTWNVVQRTDWRRDVTPDTPPPEPDFQPLLDQEARLRGAICDDASSERLTLVSRRAREHTKLSEEAVSRAAVRLKKSEEDVLQLQALRKAEMDAVTKRLTDAETRFADLADRAGSAAAQAEENLRVAKEEVARLQGLRLCDQADSDTAAKRQADMAARAQDMEEQRDAAVLELESLGQELQTLRNRDGELSKAAEDEMTAGRRFAADLQLEVATLKMQLEQAQAEARRSDSELQRQSIATGRLEAQVSLAEEQHARLIDAIKAAKDGHAAASGEWGPDVEEALRLLGRHAAPRIDTPPAPSQVPPPPLPPALLDTAASTETTRGKPMALLELESVLGTEEARNQAMHILRHCNPLNMFVVRRPPQTSGTVHLWASTEAGLQVEASVSSALVPSHRELILVKLLHVAAIKQDNVVECTVTPA